VSKFLPHLEQWLLSILQSGNRQRDTMGNDYARRRAEFLLGGVPDNQEFDVRFVSVVAVEMPLTEQSKAGSGLALVHI
jgi:hypothetical protein